jgi:membrane-bound lytic murein transglycosylase F
LKKHLRLRINLQLVGAFIALLLLIVGLQRWEKHLEMSKFPDLPQIHSQGELRALTLYSPSSYFIYRDKEMGYEYEICSMLANDLGLHLKMVVAPNRLALMQMLKNGLGDVIAYNMPGTLQDKTDFEFCGREFLTHQVLVQRKKPDGNILKDVTELIGKTIVVHENSTYHQRLLNLNEELGGGIDIQTIPNDSLSEEDLIAYVAKGKIDYTIADNNIARFNSTFYPIINTSLAISFSQHSAWAVRKTSVKLAAAIDNWFIENMKTRRYQEISKRYFLSDKKTSENENATLYPLKKGQISAYDELFKKHSSTIGWDWRLLASIAYQESHFNPRAINWTGAKGLMQIMPQTARSFGIRKDSLYNPAHNVLAASRVLKRYESHFQGISNLEQRLKMTLASYNCGVGHVMDARELTRKYGGNPFIWEDNVEKYVKLKSRPEYYEDPVCKQGYLRGSETVAFVAEVWSRFKHYQEIVPDKVSRNNSKH